MIDYILAHKDFEINENVLGIFPHLKNYQVVSQNEVKCNLPNKLIYKGLDNRLYGEYSVWEWIYKTNDWERNPFVCLHHYRRLLDRVHNNISVAAPMRFGCSIEQQTAHYHGVTVNQILREVLSKQEYAHLSQSNIFYPYNLFCTNKQLLESWLNFIEPKLMKAKEITGAENLEQMKEYLTHTDLLKPMPNKNTNIDYQSRLYATICERLNDVFWRTIPQNYFVSNIQFLEEGMNI